ncbi:Permease of the drug/metabolite transporter superfamily [Castellaniella defragrans 65Phen]|uniref:Permease of the drug/metabolite transporter superfamily n=2 Tax=Castellaniella defragrans TaxID=75697 RepID=W8WWE2_CASD6|nr:Permease of the drug/metabolite transporter superfamily [Castellaniella defragrans 65Phen]
MAVFHFRMTPMESRRPMDGLASGLMLVLCLVWALQQIVLKATAPDFSPVFQIAVRSAVGGMLVGLFMAWRGERLDGALALWRPGLFAGILYAVEFLLVGESLRHTSASHVVVLLYTAPIFAALGLHWKLPDERLAAAQWLGVALAFGGVALAFLWRDEGVRAAGAAMLWGDLLALLGGAAWGATTVVVRVTRLAALPASQTLMYQLAAGAVCLLAAAFLMGQTEFRMTPMVWASLAFQAVFVALLSYLAWFWLLRKYLASRLGVFSFLTPLFGVALGAWLLDEPVGAGFLGGTLLVVSGVVLLSGYGWYRQ